MYYVTALIAVIGMIGYQYFVKQVPETLNPMVSIIAMYAAVLIIGIVLMLIFPIAGGLKQHIGKLSWIQIALAISILMVELGFLLMYRYGWNLSSGGLITGAIVNVVLVGIGVALLGEKVTLINAIGIVLSILGVSLVSYRP